MKELVAEWKPMIVSTGGHEEMLLSTGLQVGLLFGIVMLQWIIHSFGIWQMRCELSVN